MGGESHNIYTRLLHATSHVVQTDCQLQCRPDTTIISASKWRHTYPATNSNVYRVSASSGACPNRHSVSRTRLGTSNETGNHWAFQSRVKVNIVGAWRRRRYWAVWLCISATFPQKITGSSRYALPLLTMVMSCSVDFSPDTLSVLGCSPEYCANIVSPDWRRDCFVKSITDNLLRALQVRNS